MNTFTLSDAQVIERVRRVRRYRRPLGLLFVAVGLAGIVSYAYLFYYFQAQSSAYFDEFARVTQPAPRQVAQSIDEARLDTRFGLGLLLGSGISGAVEFGVLGLVWILCRSRKDRLLLQCWDDRAAQ